MHVVDLRSGQHVGNRDDPPKSVYFAVAAAARTADAPAQRSHLDGSTQQTPCCPPRCDDVRHRLPSRQFGNPRLRFNAVTNSVVRGTMARQRRKKRAATFASGFQQTPWFAGPRSPIEKISRLAPVLIQKVWREPWHVLLAPNFVVRSPAAKRLDRQRSSGVTGAILSAKSFRLSAKT
jgi:hypothetical protein